MRRRDFLNSVGALALAATAKPSWAMTPQSTLRAGPINKTFVPDGPASRLWAYDGHIPGTLLRYKKGARARILFQNDLPDATSVHWHGIRIANDMDGVSGLTQQPIEPSSSFLYEFDLPDAGTYWYHPHNRSWDQLARGLYGPLIIDEETPYPVDRDEVLIVDDWRLTDAGEWDAASLENGHDWSHGGRLGNWATVNGQSRPAISFRPNQRVRLRLINASNARIFSIGFGDIPATLIALDGQPLGEPMTLPAGETVVIAPAQRADIVIDMTEAADVFVPTREGRMQIATLLLDGASVRNAYGPVVPLPPNDVPRPDLSAAVPVTLSMEGGAMRWLLEAEYKGRVQDGRTLAQQGQFWSFNGIVGRTDQPLFDIKRGQTVVIDIQNKTVWPHAMHVHGHHFQVVERGADDGTTAPLRDTVLLDPETSLRIAFVADNPGKWMFHCHMLEHQAAGMATWFQVS